MKDKNELVKLIQGIAWGVLGLLFIWQGIHCIGIARIIFVIFGLLDLLYAARLTRPLWGKKLDRENKN